MPDAAKRSVDDDTPESSQGHKMTFETSQPQQPADGGDDDDDDGDDDWVGPKPEEAASLPPKKRKRVKGNLFQSFCIVLLLIFLSN